MICHLGWSKRSRRRWRWLILEVGVLRWIVLKESAGGRDPGTLLLHDEPDDESSDYADSGETSDNTSSDGTCMRTSTSSAF